MDAQEEIFLKFFEGDSSAKPERIIPKDDVKVLPITQWLSDAISGWDDGYRQQTRLVVAVSYGGQYVIARQIIACDADVIYITYDYVTHHGTDDYIPLSGINIRQASR